MNQVETRRFLASIEPFKSLSAAEIGVLLSASKIREFSKGETVYNESERADGVWIIKEGRIQVFKFTASGKPFALESLAPGELFGTLCRLGSNNENYPCTAVAAEAAKVIWILESAFLELYSKSPGLLRGLCSLCSERLKDVQGLRRLGQESVPVRAASILLRLFRVHGPTIPFTKRELSELLGATLETTFRVLGDFEKKGLVLSSRGKIEIEDAEALESIVT